MSIIEHKVVRGDTLWNIAKRYGSTVEAISQKIDDPNKIRIGWTLLVPVADEPLEPPAPRRGDEPGTYTPTPDLVGALAPLGDLRRVAGNQYIGGGSTEFDDHDVIENVYFEGSVTRKDNRPRLFRNCYIPTFRVWDAFYGHWTFEDCQLGGFHDQPSRDDGGKGHGYTARRCLVEHCNDGFGIFDTSHRGMTRHDVNVTLESNLIGPLFYHNEARPEGSHNDCVQIQGGWNIGIVGNWMKALRASSSEVVPGDLKPGSVHANAGVMVNTGVASVGEVVIDRNWSTGGPTFVNVSSQTGNTPLGPITVTDNVVGVEVACSTSWDMMLNSPDAEPGEGYTVSGNTKGDGTPARVGMW